MDSRWKLTAYQLKVIAIVAMTIDHIAWMWVPATSPEGQIMHTIGRITAPIMCYLLSEGYIHTHDVRKYTLRLGITAVISAFAFCFFEIECPTSHRVLRAVDRVVIFFGSKALAFSTEYRRSRQERCVII